ncbi:chalcone isomerase family protein [Pseudomonas hefeiensis]|uniref:Chalcone isomerase family protein n=1 Tax=Pseudomonas hefeiensis TaxID=2738125 RepID=A0ABY9GI45_9PSED|nr:MULTISPECIES: chalcone isomerase family protein [unclassified Pseudomonas]WLH15303.1 chalcone isomerase family protein [Pseudomonas sp. FP205]WLH98352.1 chalcone isomerase family protein [Pseudomonas sp. FP53]WLI42619.1 chalcone isomerase family protein [Pseudomonas sp. FP821]
MARSFAFKKSLSRFMTCVLVLYASQALCDWRTVLPDARLVGQADFSWYGFDLYQARLWSSASQPSLETPLALELNYRRSISKQTLVQASIEEMRRIAGKSLDSGRLDSWTDDMRRSFVDVRAGSQITGLYLPGKGCRFYVDGRLTHEVDDPAFARFFFAIWLDPRTRYPALRQQLLGLNNTRAVGETP